MAAKDELGRRGEDLAAAWAQERGWDVLSRNWRGEGGELDLVARDGDDLVVVEVKTRSGTAFGVPQEAVTARKVARLRALTAQWLSAHDVHVAGLRIDVVAIVWRPGCEPVLEHLPAVSS